MNSKAIAPVIKEAMTKYMQGALKGNEKLIEKLVPDFPFGCRRITPSPAYLEAFHKSNVQVVTDGIKSIYEKGLITTEGEEIEVDAIVCATGFDVSFCPRFPIIGRKGNLQDIWTQELPSSYMSIAVPGMPNYFSKYLFACGIERLLISPTSFPWAKRSHRTRQCADYH